MRRRDSDYAPELATRGEILQNVARGLIGLHKRFYGRGATWGRAIFAHEDLLLVELQNVFTTVERTLIERGQRDTVRNTRMTFQSAMREEFIDCIESATGRKGGDLREHDLHRAGPPARDLLSGARFGPRSRASRASARKSADGGRPSGGIDEAAFG